jgi:predicted Zn-dependent peptidase
VTHSESAQVVHTSVAGATLGRNVIPALEIYAEILRRPHLDEAHLEPIQALALQGLQSLEDDPGSKVLYELRKRHFPDPWGRLAAGTPAGVAAATAEGLRAFHAAHYRPSGAILAVAGAVDWPALQEAVERLFGGWRGVSEPAAQSGHSGPHRDHLLKETQQTQIALAYPTVPFGQPGFYEARSAAAILGGYSSARLFTEVREKRGLCYSVQAGYESFKDRAAVVCYAGTAPERAQQTLDVTLAEIRRLARDGVEAEELEMMRAGLKSSLIMQQESTMARSAALTADWYYLGRVRPLDEIAAALDGLTPAAVSEAAARQDLSGLTIVTLGPQALAWPD